MNPEIDYYALLGLSPSAEIEVIQVVYRALAKKYHPDVYQGDKAEAERIMKELNEAHKILSEPKLRQQYNSTRASNHSTADFDETVHRTNSFSEGFFDEKLEKAFKQGAEFYPEVINFRKKLSRLSHTLSIAYAAIIVAEKKFENAETVFTEVRAEFFRKYFGTSPIVIQLASYLLDENSASVSSERRSKAKQLNQAIKVTGSPSNEVDFVRRFMKLNHIAELEIFGKHPTATSWSTGFEDGATGSPSFNKSKLDDVTRESETGIPWWLIVVAIIVIGIVVRYLVRYSA